MIVSSLIGFALAAATPSASDVNTYAAPCEIGQRYQFEQAECEFQIHNRDSRILHVVDAKPAGGKGNISPATLSIAPGQTGYLKYSVNVEDSVGQFLRFVSVKFKESSIEKRFIVTGFVLSDLDDAGLRIDFGIVNGAVGSEPKSIAMTSHAVANLHLSELVSVPDWANASIAEDGRSITVSVKPGASWGVKDDKVKVTLNTPNQKQAWITVAADVRGNIVADSNPHDLGPIRQGSANEFLVRLTSTDKKDFRIGRLSEQGGMSLKLSELPCTPASAGCKLIRVRLPENLDLGPFRGVLLVDLPDYKQALPVIFGGMLISKTTQIKSLDDEIEKQGAGKSAVAAPSPKNIDVAKAIDKAVKNQTEAPPPPGEGPLLKWTVENEQQVYGYTIYRSDSEAGPFVSVNNDVIKAALNGSGESYQWRDITAESGKAYWYYIGLINKAGRREKLSEAQKIVAK